MTQTRRLGRPRGTSLDQEQVVAAARGLATGGFANITMARVAEALGVTPMSVYRHVKDKDELLDLVMDDVLSEVVIPPPEGPWEARLQALHTNVVAALTLYPGTAQRLQELHAVLPNACRLLEGYIQVLLDAGLSDEDAISAYTTLYYLALGTVIDQAANRPATPAARQASDREAYPLLERMRPIAEGLSGDKVRAFALAAVIGGIRTLIPPKGRARVVALPGSGRRTT